MGWDPNISIVSLRHDKCCWNIVVSDCHAAEMVDTIVSSRFELFQIWMMKYLYNVPDFRGARSHQWVSGRKHIKKPSLYDFGPSFSVRSSICEALILISADLRIKIDEFVRLSRLWLVSTVFAAFRTAIHTTRCNALKFSIRGRTWWSQCIHSS